jgi:hypothetical protein
VHRARRQWKPEEGGKGISGGERLGEDKIVYHFSLFLVEKVEKEHVGVCQCRKKESRATHRTKNLLTVVRNMLDMRCVLSCIGGQQVFF